MIYQILAFGEIARVFIRWPQQQGLNIRYGVADDGDRSNVGLHILDGHHAANEGDGWRVSAAVQRRRRIAFKIYAIRNNTELFWWRPVFDLILLITAIKRQYPTGRFIRGVGI